MLSLFSRNDEMLIGKFAPLEMVAGLGLTICVGSLTKMAVLFNFFFSFPSACVSTHFFIFTQLGSLLLLQPSFAPPHFHT